MLEKSTKIISGFFYFQIYLAKIWRLLHGKNSLSFVLWIFFVSIHSSALNNFRHGKRRTVSTDDVKLLARRSTALVSSHRAKINLHKTHSTHTLPHLNIYFTAHSKFNIRFAFICFSPNIYKIKARNWTGSRRIWKRRIRGRGRAETQMRKAGNRKTGRWIWSVSVQPSIKIHRN